jgi:hypothetical protein
MQRTISWAISWRQGHWIRWWLIDILNAVILECYISSPSQWTNMFQLCINVIKQNKKMKTCLILRVVAICWLLFCQEKKREYVHIVIFVNQILALRCLGNLSRIMTSCTTFSIYVNDLWIIYLIPAPDVTQLPVYPSNNSQS